MLNQLTNHLTGTSILATAIASYVYKLHVSRLGDVHIDRHMLLYGKFNYRDTSL